LGSSTQHSQNRPPVRRKQSVILINVAGVCVSPNKTLQVLAFRTKEWLSRRERVLTCSNWKQTRKLQCSTGNIHSKQFFAVHF